MGLIDSDDGWRMPDWPWEKIERSRSKARKPMASIKPGALHRFAPLVFGLSGTDVRLAAEKVFAFSGMRNCPISPGQLLGSPTIKIPIVLMCKNLYEPAKRL